MGGWGGAGEGGTGQMLTRKAMSEDSCLMPLPSTKS